MAIRAIQPDRAPTDDEALTKWLVGDNAPLAPRQGRLGGGAAMARARLQSTQKDDPQPQRCYPELTVQLLTRGRLSFAADLGAGRFSTVAEAGDFIVTPPNCACVIDAEVEADVETVALALPISLTETLLPAEFNSFDPLYAGTARSDIVANSLERLWLEMGSTGGSALLTQSRILAVLSELLRLASAPTRNAAKGGLSPARLARACEAMDAGMRDGVTLTDIAALVGLSPAHFSRAFHQSMGVSPTVWLRSRMVERAKDLMRQGGSSLAEIAQELGFSAQPQFTTAFRRVAGLPPGAWLKLHRGEH